MNQSLYTVTFKGINDKVALVPAYPDHVALYNNQTLELPSDDNIKLLNTSFCLFPKDSNFVIFTTCKTNKSLLQGWTR